MFNRLDNGKTEIVLGHGTVLLGATFDGFLTLTHIRQPLGIGDGLKDNETVEELGSISIYGKELFEIYEIVKVIDYVYEDMSFDIDNKFIITFTKGSNKSLKIFLAYITQVIKIYCVNTAS